MSLAIFIEEAENDLRESYEWYQAKDADLALQFMMSVRQIVDVIEKSPLRFPIVAITLRKAPVKKFPFNVWYITDGESTVIACLHGRRSPSIALDRLRRLGPSPE